MKRFVPLIVLACVALLPIGCIGGGLVIWKVALPALASGGPAPAAPAVLGPSLATQQAFAPLRQVMAAGDQEKAAKLTSAWQDFLLVLQTTPSKPPTVGAFKASLLAFAEAAARRRNLAGSFQGFSDAMEVAFTTVFPQDGKLEQAQAEEFTRGIIWACGGSP